MKHFIFLSLIFLSLSADAKSKSAILLVGDSWLQLPCVFRTYSEVLAEYGHKDKKVECLHTTKSGSEVDDWLEQEKKEKVIKALQKHPEMNIVVLSIGGNDLLGEWNKSMSQDEVNELYERVEKKTLEIIAYILDVRPEIKVVLTGYDYANFNVLKPGSIKAYDLLFNRMGRPTPSELNHFVGNSSIRVARLIRNIERAYFVSNFGLGQYLYGLPEYNIKPFELPHPGTAEDLNSILGGDPNLPQYPKTLLNIDEFKIYDPYHLSKKGYKNVARNLMETYLKDWIK